jgi:hypothetical protein
MPRLLLLTSFVLLIANSSFAQSGVSTPSQCLLVRQAVAHMDSPPRDGTPWSTMVPKP